MLLKNLKENLKTDTDQTLTNLLYDSNLKKLQSLEEKAEISQNFDIIQDPIFLSGESEDKDFIDLNLENESKIINIHNDFILRPFGCMR